MRCELGQSLPPRLSCNLQEAKVILHNVAANCQLRLTTITTETTKYRSEGSEMLGEESVSYQCKVRKSQVEWRGFLGSAIE